jgi:hypothetical protein
MHNERFGLTSCEGEIPGQSNRQNSDATVTGKEAPRAPILPFLASVEWVKISRLIWTSRGR